VASNKKNPVIQRKKAPRGEKSNPTSGGSKVRTGGSEEEKKRKKDVDTNLSRMTGKRRGEQQRGESVYKNGCKEEEV